MTTREHLKKMHQDAIEHHTTMSDECGKAAGLFSKAGNAPMAECFKAMQASHEACKENHTSMSKSIDVEDLSKANQIVPDHISVVAPAYPANVRAVPRAGQREIGKAEQNVPIEFADLVKISDD